MHTVHKRIFFILEVGGWVVALSMLKVLLGKFNVTLCKVKVEGHSLSVQGYIKVSYLLDQQMHERVDLMQLQHQLCR